MAILRLGDENYDVDSTLRQLDRVDCEDSLYTFLRHAWTQIEAVPFTEGWPLEAITDHLQAVVDGEIRRLIINIPPRTGKTTICSVAFPAWTWIQRTKTPTSGPHVKFLYGSHSHNLALDASMKCRLLLESPWYQSLWGNRFKIKDDQNTKIRFDNDKHGYRMITSVESKITGQGGDIIVMDDPNNAAEAHSQVQIENVIKWWTGTMSSRLNDPKTGCFVLIQQRIAENDLTGHILENSIGDWVHLRLPMYYEPIWHTVTSIGWNDPRKEEAELLWPERIGEEELARIKREKSKDEFSGQYQQDPRVSGGGVIKDDWWIPWEYDKFPPLEFIMASMDTAYTIKQENDFSAMTIWGIFSSVETVTASRLGLQKQGILNIGDQYVNQPAAILLYAWQERLEFPDLVAKTIECCKKFKVDKLLIENKAAGISLEQELRRLLSYENFSIQLVDPKNTDKLARLYSVQHIFSEGMIYAPRRPYADMVIKQVGQFPRGAHDDLCDTVSQAIRFLRDSGMLTRRIESDTNLVDNMMHQHNSLPSLYGI